MLWSDIIHVFAILIEINHNDFKCIVILDKQTDNSCCYKIIDQCKEIKSYYYLWDFLECFY